MFCCRDGPPRARHARSQRPAGAPPRDVLPRPRVAARAAHGRRARTPKAARASGPTPRVPVRRRADDRPARRRRAALPRGGRARYARATSTSPTSSATSCRSSARPARSRRSGAPTAAATGSSGRSAGSPTTPPATSTCVDSSHDRIEKFEPNGDVHQRSGGTGQRSSASSTSAPRRTTPTRPAAASRSPANTCTSPTAATTASSASTSKAAKRSPGARYGSGPGQFSYPRGVAANENEVIVSDDDNHRIEKFSPRRRLRVGRSARSGSGPGQFGFPYGVALDAAGNVYVADDINDRVVKLSPQLTFAGRLGRLRLETRPAGVPARARERSGRRHLRRGHRQRSRRGVRPERRVPAHDRHLRAWPRRADRAARARASTRAGGCSSPTRSTTASRRSPAAGGAYAGQWTIAGGQRGGLHRPVRHRHRPARSVYVADAGDARLVHLWGDGTYLGELGGPAELGGAALSGAGSVAVSAAHGSDLRRRQRAQSRARLRPRRARCARSGAPTKATAPRAAQPAQFDRPSAVAVDALRQCLRRRHRQQSRRQALTRRDRARRMGLARRRRRALPLTDRHRRRRGRARCIVVDSENNRVEVFDGQRPVHRQVGLTRHRPRRFLAADGDRDRLRRRRRTWPTRTTTASSAST